MVADLRRLVSGSASSSRNPVIEASSRVQGARGTSRSSASSSGDSSSSPPACLERLLMPAQVAGLAPRVVKIKWKRASKRWNAPGSRVRTSYLGFLPTRKVPRTWRKKNERRE